MISSEGFATLVEEIKEQGYDEESACRYAELLADRPVFNNAGELLVMDGKEVIATLEPLEF